MRPELVTSAQAGDRQAFDALATALYGRLYAVARRILRDGYAAEEAVQECLIRSWRELRSLRDPARFEAWMHRLLINSCHDHGRKIHRFAVEVPEISIDPSDPSDDFATVVNVDQLERGFLRLSVEHRAVLVLTHYVGMSATEVSDVLQIPVGTVYSRLHYGIRAMRAVLSESPHQQPAGALSENGR